MYSNNNKEQRRLFAAVMTLLVRLLGMSATVGIGGAVFRFFRIVTVKINNRGTT